MVMIGDQIKFRGEDAVVVEVNEVFIRVRILGNKAKQKYALLPPVKNSD